MDPFFGAPTPKGLPHFGATRQQHCDCILQGAPPMRSGRRIQPCIDRFQRSQQSSDHAPARRGRIVILQPSQIADSEFADGPRLFRADRNSGAELVSDNR